MNIDSLIEILEKEKAINGNIKVVIYGYDTDGYDNLKVSNVLISDNPKYGLSFAPRYQNGKNEKAILLGF